MRSRILILLAPALLLAAQPRANAPEFQKVYPLEPAEGVFAYARISPNGRFLAYASEERIGPRSSDVKQTINVVDLNTRKVLFTEPGIDAYFSPDGGRMIFLSFAGSSSVSIRHHDTGQLVRRVAPAGLGDYYSWAVHEGRNLILTIRSNYYYLDGDQAVLPAGRVPPCPGIGTGDRPLISRDGKLITTFVNGNVVVRSRTNCDYIFDTGLRGAKADFSPDGRYIAFHSPKARGRGYDLQVVDLRERTVRTITNFAGSSFFPSWTDDFRLSFRYDGDDYRGFMMASNVLSAPARPLPNATVRTAATPRTWSALFPETAAPTSELSIVLVWAPWSAHSPMALRDLQRARDYFAQKSIDVGVLTATDPASITSDVQQMRTTHGIDLPQIPLAAERVPFTEAHSQIPTALLFRGSELIDRHLGPQTFAELREWINAERNGNSHH